MTLVAWSGGCDSTLAILEEHRNFGGPVRAISVSHEQVDGCVAQAKAQQHLLLELEQRGIYVEHQTVVVKHQRSERTRTQIGVCDTGGVIQPQIWLGLLVPYLEPNEDLVLGYVRGDDVWHHWRAMQDAFDGISRLGHRQGKLRAPLEWLHKAEVLRRLRHEGLLDLCVYCEDLAAPCHVCRSCITHETALWQLENAPWQRELTGDSWPAPAVDEAVDGPTLSKSAS